LIALLQPVKRAGFTVDSPVTIRVMHGCLVLTAE
jgi:hypothetical protein